MLLDRQASGKNGEKPAPFEINTQTNYRSAFNTMDWLLALVPAARINQFPE